MSQNYDSKYVQTPKASELNPKELALVVDSILELLGKEIVKTKYQSHGDAPITEITLGDEHRTETGSFDSDGNQTG